MPWQTNSNNPTKIISSSLLLFSSSLLFIQLSILHMKTFSVLSFSFLFYSLVSASSFTEFLFPNFTASNFLFIDNKGTFLLSRNETFKAAIFSPTGQDNFYLSVIHVASSTIIWSANRDAPISNSGEMDLTVEGIRISDHHGNTKWSTPPLRSSVKTLMLTEMGNLVLLDKTNTSLWESFQHPTDMIVIGQHLPQGAVLASAVSNVDLSTGDYRLSVTDSDAVLQWHGQIYWKLSMETNAFRNSDYVVDYMVLNRTGLFLLGLNGSAIVIQMSLLQPSDFSFVQLGSSGQFIITSFSGTKMEQEFVGPANGCQIPLACGKIGLCTMSSRPTCSCPVGFDGGSGSQKSSNCLPSDGLTLPSACNSTKNSSSQLNSSSISYIRLAYGMDYFAIDFSEPKRFSVNLSVCQDLCMVDCSCLGIFYENSTGSCYTLENELGSIISSTTDEDDLLGYIKVIAGSFSNVNKTSNEHQHLPLLSIVLLPITVFLLLVVFCFVLWRRWRRIVKKNEIKLGHRNSLSSGDLDAFFIPGLPQRFDYEELDLATDNFKTQVGSGGFGAVYKGILPDKSVVAVKKITNLGLQGKKDFCTEIAVIGSIHHVNLVKLRGFCAQGRQRLLVYEYMDRGSLEKTLFGSSPVLEWQERYEIALGTARGLAYLHAGCEQKIIHCDVKPENILLNSHFQVKLSDFGLSKLLSPEESSLFTTMRGTRGYLAPEWLTNSAISEKTDVYSFGMVLLELVSGRKNCSTRSQTHSIDNSNSGGGGHSSSSSTGSALAYFPLFALEMHELGRYLELADPRLERRVTTEEVEKLVLIALSCVHEEPTWRPNMVNIVGMLEGSIPLCQPRVESLNFLRFYGRRFTEASMIGEEDNDFVSFPLANKSNTSSDSHVCFSYISSQQISGPR
ncbi:G-type lectin S-receptor-like serine/threonine-protein kinase At5g35370 [Euphorbia lathyris]|uniref:G-type lectin S-receptor-like serine/threonine-protein kinase At5g35370 n=1 Tax=Euphorbia lathyris TaxID=212925 RepID=UPI003313BF99